MKWHYMHSFIFCSFSMQCRSCSGINLQTNYSAEYNKSSFYHCNVYIIVFILDCRHPQVPSCPDRIRHQREHFVRGGDPGLRDQGGGRQGRPAPLLRHPPVWHPGQGHPRGRRQLPAGDWWSAPPPPVSVSGVCPQEHQLAGLLPALPWPQEGDELPGHGQCGYCGGHRRGKQLCRGNVENIRPSWG